MNCMTRTLLLSGALVALPLAGMAATPAPTRPAAPAAMAPAAHPARPTAATPAAPAHTRTTPAQPPSSAPGKPAKASTASARWVDANNGTREQLMQLAGVTDTIADAIIAGRPYTSKAELLNKKIVDARTYKKIARYLTVKTAPKESSHK